MVALYLSSPYGPYGLYRASVPVQGWPLPSAFTVCVNRKLQPVCPIPSQHTYIVGCVIRRSNAGTHNERSGQWLDDLQSPWMYTEAPSLVPVFDIRFLRSSPVDCSYWCVIFGPYSQFVLKSFACCQKNLNGLHRTHSSPAWRGIPAVYHVTLYKGVHLDCLVFTGVFVLVNPMLFHSHVKSLSAASVV